MSADVSRQHIEMTAPSLEPVFHLYGKEHVPDGQMHLDDWERSALAGEFGEGTRTAMSYLLDVGVYYRADGFVPITHAHFTGDWEVMGDAGLELLRGVAVSEVSVKVMTTRNSTAVDFRFAEQLELSPELIEREIETRALLGRLGVSLVHTCTAHQNVYQPQIGEHVAWGDTGMVAYANAVFGARSNYEAGPTALYAGIVGRTPKYGMHLDENRVGTSHYLLDAELVDVADWGALGALIGTTEGSYFRVPVISLINESVITSDSLKHLSASLASYGSLAMFHVVGHTPEAPTLEGAFAGRQVPKPTLITDADIEAYQQPRTSNEKADLVVLSAPQLSFAELENVSSLLAGRSVHIDSEFIITTSRMVRTEAEEANGVITRLEEAGALVLDSGCWYMMQPERRRRRYKAGRLVTNSAKLVNIARAHGYEGLLRRTSDCVEAAVSGQVH